MTNGRLTVRVSRFALPVLRAAAGAVLAAALCSCSTVAQVGTSIGQAAGVLTPQQAESINRSAVAVEKTFQDITPEQEYYIGRAVAATVLGAYRPYGNPEATQYLNLLG
jgi:hypothetical protein